MSFQIFRSHTIDGVPEEPFDLDWQTVREHRNLELERTDWWAVSDLTMSQERIDYRIFLRDLPQNFESANDAADAWAAYTLPE